VRSRLSAVSWGAWRVGSLALTVCVVLAAGARARQTAKLEVGLYPERLGQGTTVEFAFAITATGAQVPSPVTRIALRYPKHFGLVTSGLGLASCTERVLEELGPEGCPSRSLMGEGTAVAEVQVGEKVLQEQAHTAIFMAPLGGENINIEFIVNGYSPLAAELIFPGLLLPAAPPYGGDLSIPVPLLESFPEGPDVSLVKIRSTIGPLGLTYYEHRRGKFIPYTPSGIVLPPHCPAGGFPFSITLHFADGTSSTNDAKVPCPRPAKGRRG
jgi:hypothetical protein